MAIGSTGAQLGKCVLLAPRFTAGIDLRDIIHNAVSRAGLRLIHPDENVLPGQSFSESIIQSLRSADAIVAILNNEGSPNFWLELGMALAVNEKLILVQTAPDVAVPYSLTSILTVGPVVTEKAIELAIRRVQRGRRHGTPESLTAATTGYPLGDKVDLLLEELHATGTIDDSTQLVGPKRYSKFEDWVARVLSEAGVPHERSHRVENENQSTGVIDFVVSTDELSRNLGSVLPIEVLMSSRGSKHVFQMIRQRIGSFRRFFQGTGAETILVLINEFDQGAQLVDSWDGSLLICSAADLLGSMRDATFGNAVLSIRNSAVHRGDVW